MRNYYYTLQVQIEAESQEQADELVRLLMGMGAEDEVSEVDPAPSKVVGWETTYVREAL